MNSSAASLTEIEQTRSHGRIDHLPVWDAFTPDDVKQGITALLDVTKDIVRDLENDAPATWDGLMVPMEKALRRLNSQVGVVNHLLSVKFSESLLEAYEAVRPAYVAFSSQVSQSQGLYRKLIQIRDSQWQGLSDVRRRILTQDIRGMERSGVHLEGQARSRFEEIQTELSRLSNDFQNNLVRQEKDSRIKVTQTYAIAGIPASILKQAADRAVEDGVEGADAEAGPWHFVVNGVNFQAVLQQGEDRNLREEFYRAFRLRGSRPEFNNRPLLEEILRLRQETAALVGFENFAEFSIDNKMAPSTDSVWSLLNDLESAARPAAIKEFEDLKAFMQETGFEHADDPAPWDIAFYSQRLQRKLYGYDAEALREYFQMPRVLEGLFSLIQKLYGVRIHKVDSAALPVWDDSVSFYEVLEGDDVIAGFYVDPYARPGEKRGGAWMNTVVDRSLALGRGADEASLPVALFVMNGRAPAQGKPALMSLDEVRTLFHEFGHATQHMFTRIDEGGASGMNLVEWDSVELASQFNEYWMEHKPYLLDMSAHVDTGEPLPGETADQIINSKNFMVGNATLRQVLFARTDMKIHESFGLPAIPEQATPYQIEREIAQATIVMPTLKDETQLPGFGHLFSGGYAAGYYSYKWAEVLAADAFAAFREAGLDNPQAVHEIAQRFKQTVLGLGGSLPAAEVYRLFRGRDATADALLADQGLV
ncbi:MAG: M3 family metallopeptidase [Proteobacteria bacterium]|nr:M3 family metallopeptidase [Pseudomonadota bacterium]